MAIGASRVIKNDEPFQKMIEIPEVEEISIDMGIERNGLEPKFRTPRRFCNGNDTKEI